MPKPVDSRHGEAVIAVALILVGMAAVALAWPMPIGTLALPGPRVFPTAIGLTLAGVGAALLMGALAGRHRGPPPATVEIGHRDVVVTLVVLFAAAAAFERLGAAATFAALLFVLMRCLARIAWWQAAAVALSSTAMAWLVFTRLLGVRLPGLAY